MDADDAPKPNASQSGVEATEGDARESASEDMED